MALSERLTHPPARRSRPCAVGRLLADLPAEDYIALHAALRQHGQWTTSDILRELRAEGHGVSYATVRRHREGECSCGTR